MSSQTGNASNDTSRYSSFGVEEASSRLEEIKGMPRNTPAEVAEANKALDQYNERVFDLQDIHPEHYEGLGRSVEEAGNLRHQLKQDGVTAWRNQVASAPENVRAFVGAGNSSAASNHYTVQYGNHRTATVLALAASGKIDENLIVGERVGLDGKKTPLSVKELCETYRDGALLTSNRDSHGNPWVDTKKVDAIVKDFDPEKFFDPSRDGGVGISINEVPHADVGRYHNYSQVSCSQTGEPITHYMMRNSDPDVVSAHTTNRPHSNAALFNEPNLASDTHQAQHAPAKQPSAALGTAGRAMNIGGVAMSANNMVSSIREGDTAGAIVHGTGAALGVADEVANFVPKGTTAGNSLGKSGMAGTAVSAVYDAVSTAKQDLNKLTREQQGDTWEVTKSISKSYAKSGANSAANFVTGGLAGDSVKVLTETGDIGKALAATAPAQAYQAREAVKTMVAETNAEMAPSVDKSTFGQADIKSYKHLQNAQVGLENELMAKALKENPELASYQKEFSAAQRARHNELIAQDPDLLHATMGAAPEHFRDTMVKIEEEADRFADSNNAADVEKYKKLIVEPAEKYAEQKSGSKNGASYAAAFNEEAERLKSGNKEFVDAHYKKMAVDRGTKLTQLVAEHDAEYAKSNPDKPGLGEHVFHQNKITDEKLLKKYESLGAEADKHAATLTASTSPAYQKALKEAEEKSKNPEALAEYIDRESRNQDQKLREKISNESVLTSIGKGAVMTLADEKLADVETMQKASLTSAREELKTWKQDLEKSKEQKPPAPQEPQPQQAPLSSPYLTQQPAQPTNFVMQSSQNPVPAATQPAPQQANPVHVKLMATLKANGIENPNPQVIEAMAAKTPNIENMPPEMAKAMYAANEQVANLNKLDQSKTNGQNLPQDRYPPPTTQVASNQRSESAGRTA